MAVHLQKELENLKQDLLSLGGEVEDAVRLAVRSLKNFDAVLGRKVLDADRKIDQMEVDVEEKCLKALALHQPVAIDLRFVISTLKINNDLERVGDLAVNVAERAIFLSEQESVTIPFDFEDMAERTRGMLKKSLDSLVQMDAKMAEQVCNEDAVIDAIHREVYAKIYQDIKKQPEQAEVLIQYLSVSKHLERMADYATNIAEDVIYMVEGSIVRHSSEGHVVSKEAQES